LEDEQITSNIVSQRQSSVIPGKRKRQPERRQSHHPNYEVLSSSSDDNFSTVSKIYVTTSLLTQNLEIGSLLQFAPRRENSHSLVSKGKKKAPVILHSAFRRPTEADQPSHTIPEPTSHWSRNPAMNMYKFTRTKATFNTSAGDVQLSVQKEDEFIEIAGDWSSGEIAFEEKKSYHDTGYIGRGYTKRGIYVSKGKLPMQPQKW
jgi:hypothetical protein